MAQILPSVTRCRTVLSDQHDGVVVVRNLVVTEFQPILI